MWLIAAGLSAVSCCVFWLIWKIFLPRAKGTRKLPSVEYLRKLYEENKDKGELYHFQWNKKPAVLLTNLDLILAVLMDSQNFNRRDNFYDESDEFKSSHLANLYGSKWKLLRKYLGKAFNSCAMKYLVENFHCFYWKFAGVRNLEGGEMDLNDSVYFWTLCGVMDLAFNVQCETTTKNIFQHLFSPHKKKLSDKVFFLENVKAFEKIGREKKTFEKSFFKILKDLRNQDLISSVNIAAQSYVFCSAGTESVALSVLYCIYEMALNPMIQQRLKMEMHEVLNNNDVTKENLSDMIYLDCCVKETLRKYTIGTMLKRLCDNDYQTANGNIIKKGTFVVVPMEAIHKDATIFTNPEEFNPERFLVNNFHRMSFLAFGAGKRGCIGAKFGEYQVKLLLIRLLSLYEFSRCEATEVPITMDPKSKFIKPLHRIVLNVKKIAND